MSQPVPHCGPEAMTQLAVPANTGAATDLVHRTRPNPVCRSISPEVSEQGRSDVFEGLQKEYCIGDES